MSQHDDDEQRLRYERVAETGFADFEDLERFQATKRERKWCEAHGRVTLHRDHVIGLPDDEMVCLRCFMESLS